LYGAVAEWLGRGLQSLVQQFDSAPRLDRFLAAVAILGGRKKLELARQYRAPDGDQNGRYGNQAERGGRRYEEGGGGGGHDHERGKGSEDKRATVFPHGSA
jgi:hypothetical protein